MNEIWKSIPGYEGYYEASTHGRIRRVGKKKCLSDSPITKKNPYRQVMLCMNSKTRHYRVHTLIALTFLGERPEGCEINHIDTNKVNNHADNLEYVTHQRNVDHAIENGLTVRIDDAKCNEVQRLLNQRPLLTMQAIAEQTGLSRPTIRKISRGEGLTYKHYASNAQRTKHGYKFTEQDIIDIRAMLASGEYTNQEVADIYNVHNSTISLIKTGKRHPR